MCKRLLVLLMVLGIAGSANAVWIDFMLPGEGNWSDDSNWNNNPDFGNLPHQPYPYQNAAFGVGTNTCHILAGESYEVTGMLGPAWNAYSTLSVAGTLLMTAGCEIHPGYAMTFAHEDNSIGVLNITGDGSVTASAQGVVIADKGDADINLSGNAVLSVVAAGVGASLGVVWETQLGVPKDPLHPEGPFFTPTGNINFLSDTSRFIITGADVTGDMAARIGSGHITGAGVTTWYSGGDTYVGVPEPATIVLLGLGGLALLRRKRA